MDHPLLEPKIRKSYDSNIKGIMEVVEKDSLTSIPYSEVTNALWDIGVQLEAFKMPSNVSCIGKSSILFKWNAVQTITSNYMIFLHIRDNNGNNLVVGDAIPNSQDHEYPTSKWKQGDIILDEHQLLFRGDISTGSYTVKVGFTRLEGVNWVNVPVSYSTERSTEFTLPNLFIYCHLVNLDNQQDKY